MDPSASDADTKKAASSFFLRKTHCDREKPLTRPGSARVCRFRKSKDELLRKDDRHGRRV